jgi:gamma-glutamyltranspeptidase/glutathione hydrolase
MGGFMQPQGHVQVIRNLVDFHCDPQEALDSPRWYLNGVGITQSPNDVEKSEVMLEDGYGGRGEKDTERESIEEGDDRGEKVRERLEERGHKVLKIVKGSERSIFGRGQVIVRYPNGIICGGSDPRADGCALPCVYPLSISSMNK